MNKRATQPVDDTGRAQELLQRATTAYRKAQLAEAVELGQLALALIVGLPASETRRDALLDAAYRRIAEALDRSGRFEEARQVLNDWEQATQRPEGRVDILALWARLSYRRGEFERAMRFIDEGTSLAQASGYTIGMAALMRFRADVLWMRGEAEQALVVAQQALAIYERMNDLEGRARALNTVAAVHHTMGRFYQAIKYLLRAITLLESLGDRVGLCIVYANIGESYQKIYAMQTALFYHQQAMEMCAGNVSADLLRNLGVDLVAVGRTEEGIARLLEAWEKARALGETDQILQCLHSLAEAVFNIGQITEARTLATQLLTMAQPLNAVRHIVRAVLILGYCARAEGDEVTAQEYFHEGFMTAQRVSDKAMIWQTHAALAEMLEDTQPELAAVHSTVAREMLENILLSIEDDVLQETFRKAPPVAKVLNARQNRQ